MDSETEILQETEVAEVLLRKATVEDVKVSRKDMREGLFYWLKSDKTGKFDKKNYVITEHTDPYEVANWLAAGMMYVLLTTPEQVCTAT